MPKVLVALAPAVCFIVLVMSQSFARAVFQKYPLIVGCLFLTSVVFGCLAVRFKRGESARWQTLFPWVLWPLFYLIEAGVSSSPSQFSDFSKAFATYFLFLTVPFVIFGKAILFWNLTALSVLRFKPVQRLREVAVPVVFGLTVFFREGFSPGANVGSAVAAFCFAVFVAYAAQSQVGETRKNRIWSTLILASSSGTMAWFFRDLTLDELAVYSQERAMHAVYDAAIFAFLFGIQEFFLFRNRKSLLKV